MYGHGYIIAESMVVEEVYTEEQDNVDQPPPNWDLVLLEEEGRSFAVELRR